ncbi:MAG: ABC transporter ATP-binding protein/permease [Actinobacteria bacterium]|nr:ABC transporter ATP-binding protein/permease [Actinomycetota bacterium]MBU1493640.1 ABC transporter ATP-binding protein/permease [Actinomycetota bacterium]
MTTEELTPRAPTARIGWQLIKNQRLRYGINAMLWMSIWVMPVIPALLTRAFFDRIDPASTNPVGFTVPTLIALMLGYGFARLGVMVTGMWTDVHFMFRTGTQLRRNMLARVFEMPGAQAVERSAGEAISRFREDVDEVEESLSWTVDLMGLTVFSAVAMAVMLSIDTRVTLFVFAPTVGVVYIAAQARKRIRRYREAARIATGQITEALGETFGAVQSIKVAGAEAPMIEHFRGLNDVRRSAMVRDRVLTAMLESAFWNTVNIGTGLILIVGARNMASGEFTVGDFAVFTYFLTFVSDAVFVLGLFIARFQQAGISFGRMIALLRGAPPLTLAAGHELYLTGEVFDPAESLPAVEPLDELRVEGLSFTYPDSTAGIADVDLVVPGGSFTVVTGKVGSGKTTLLRAILGLVDAHEGTIRWNGEAVDDPAGFFVPPRSAYTPQVPRLFSMSLRDNLLMGRPELEERLDSAIRSAVMGPDLEEMPEGLDTMVGPLGVRLSGGQVQRSAAARMFVRDPEVLVFDDLSSALDVETERILWDRLFAERAGVTSLVVSHRRPALQRADQIVVMEGGRVAATGTLEELLETSEEFRALWKGEVG